MASQSIYIYIYINKQIKQTDRDKSVLMKLHSRGIPNSKKRLSDVPSIENGRGCHIILKEMAKQLKETKESVREEVPNARYFS